MTTNQQKLPKGYAMEELLRSYFLKSGYFVVRGVPFIYEGFDVTDIDIWLYGRTSSVSREVVIVDAKNKKTPQAMERIFWVQGLRLATKASNAIVATTDRRPEVRKFGKQLGITVLDGAFLSKLANSDNINIDRIADEDFNVLIDSYELSKLDGNWKARIQYSKSLLARPLSFDSCNTWLQQAHFFAEHAITSGKQREIALRCLYLLCSFTAIALDFLMKEISFYDQLERSKTIAEGFTYGSRGNAGTKRIVDLAMGLVENHIKDGKSISKQINDKILIQLKDLNAGILGEYFARSEVARGLFFVAKDFEKMAMNKSFLDHSTASVEVKGMLFCLLDFWGISRTLFSAR